jgi:hypothetical protein
MCLSLRLKGERGGAYVLEYGRFKKSVVQVQSSTTPLITTYGFQKRSFGSRETNKNERDISLRIIPSPPFVSDITW